MLTKFHQSHADNISYVKPKTQKPSFGVRHYAGEVTYQVEGFLDKNRDTVRQDILEVMEGSGNSLVAHLFSPDVEQIDDPFNKRQGTAQYATMKRSAKSNTTGSQFSVRP